MSLIQMLTDKTPTAIWLNLGESFKRGDVIFWNNNFYQIVDDSRKDINMYICVKQN